MLLLISSTTQTTWAMALINFIVCVFLSYLTARFIAAIKSSERPVSFHVELGFLFILFIALVVFLGSSVFFYQRTEELWPFIIKIMGAIIGIVCGIFFYAINK